MILGKKDSLIGLDIGSRSVKVAEITETKTGRKLRRFGMADIPPGAIEDGAISGKMAKEVSEEMYQTGKPPQTIIAEKGLIQITDESALAAVIETIMAANPTQLAQYRGGKDKLFGFFVGQVMKATQGKANPQLINDLLKKMLV